MEITDEKNGKKYSTIIEWYMETLTDKIVFAQDIELAILIDQVRYKLQEAERKSEGVKLNENEVKILLIFIRKLIYKMDCEPIKLLPVSP